MSDPERNGKEGAPARPAFLITIDTEGDDVWARPRNATTRNARFLPRFQALCESYGLRPTYLVNFEMAKDDAFRAFGVDLLKRQAAEIGMHMHAWDTPPIEPLGVRDWIEQPYAFEYPPQLVSRKAAFMTQLLQERFDIAPTSHRAGRWGFDAAYAASLVALGYRVDCSVTPRTSWRNHPGASTGTGGPDFTASPSGAYLLGPGDVTRPGAGPLLEVPMTITEGVRPWPRAVARRLLGRTGPKIVWLRPNGRNLRDLLFIVAKARRENWSYIQFTLHSSEFMPGGSPSFRTEASIETLYRHLEILFEATRDAFVGSTLSAFAARMQNAIAGTVGDPLAAEA